ncbi:PspC domain-containing protein [Baekduia sp.]|uniref:ATP-binding protein n=1 Tax=Baekduia sp. TaxID=2600305 RepID=UPI002E0AA5F4|nr:PspC domain-containing protein [Baekduia sp.]
MAKPQRPPLRRDDDRKVVAGVCAGAARWLGVDPLILRIVVIIATVASGVGLPIYIAGWLLLPPADGSPAIAARLRARPGAWQIGAGVGCLTLGGLLTIRELGLWWSDAIVWPFVLAAAGAAMLWRQTAARRAGPEPTRSPRDGVQTADELTAAVEEPALDTDEHAPLGSAIPQRLRAVYQGGFGIALVVGAGLLFLQANGALSGARDLVLAFVVVALGLGLILAPFWLRLVRGLNDERNERIRSQERAEVAAHLHDSVLQTLALVQKQADDPRAVATLARRQERELRGWLSGAPDARPDDCLADALRAAAEEIEEAHGVPIEVIAVGDHDLDDRHRALVAAAREALANAVRHSASDEPIALYVEVAGGRTEVFVRDRGQGFDANAIPEDRRGVRESIVGRMARHGGTAAVHSTPGQGTEVELVLDD